MWLMRRGSDDDDDNDELSKSTSSNLSLLLASGAIVQWCMVTYILTTDSADFN